MASETLLFISGPAFFVSMFHTWNLEPTFSDLETVDKISNGPRRPPVGFSPYPLKHLASIRRF
jgi:hypothetical protein